MHRPVKRVAITGGTHGNELTGVYLAKKFMGDMSTVSRESFETIVMHTNKKAIKECRRYIDRDLNRAFTPEELADESRYLYEDIAAKLINERLGPKGSDEPYADFIVDLHSTTSNMGLSIVIDNGGELTWRAAAYLMDMEPEVNIFHWLGDTGDASFVNSIAKEGFAIEVGAVPQGVLRADIFEETEKLTAHLMDFFEKHNRGEITREKREIEIYEFAELIDFPRDGDGDLAGMVHPYLQDKDYTLLKKGDPVFVDMDGNDILYERDEPMHALFVNEAAYYEKGFAMCLARKKRITI